MIAIILLDVGFPFQLADKVLDWFTDLPLFTLVLTNFLSLFSLLPLWNEIIWREEQRQIAANMIL